jgi:hypothetical protein
MKNEGRGEEGKQRKKEYTSMKATRKEGSVYPGFRTPLTPVRLCEVPTRWAVTGSAATFCEEPSAA